MKSKNISIVLIILVATLAFSHAKAAEQTDENQCDRSPVTASLTGKSEDDTKEVLPEDGSLSDPRSSSQDEGIEYPPGSYTLEDLTPILHFPIGPLLNCELYDNYTFAQFYAKNDPRNVPFYEDILDIAPNYVRHPSVQNPLADGSCALYPFLFLGKPSKSKSSTPSPITFQISEDNTAILFKTPVQFSGKLCLGCSHESHTKRGIKHPPLKGHLSVVLDFTKLWLYRKELGFPYQFRKLYTIEHQRYSHPTLNSEDPASNSPSTIRNINLIDVLAINGKSNYLSDVYQTFSISQAEINEHKFGNPKEEEKLKDLMQLMVQSPNYSRILKALLSQHKKSHSRHLESSKGPDEEILDRTIKKG